MLFKKNYFILPNKTTQLQPLGDDFSTLPIKFVLFHTFLPKMSHQFDNFIYDEMLDHENNFLYKEDDCLQEDDKKEKVTISEQIDKLVVKELKQGDSNTKNSFPFLKVTGECKLTFLKSGFQLRQSANNKHHSSRNKDVYLHSSTGGQRQLVSQTVRCTLTNHLPDCLRKSAKRFLCQQCDKCYSDLASHRVLFHGDYKLHECKKCDKAFTHKDAFLKHWSEAHKNVENKIHLKPQSTQPLLSATGGSYQEPPHSCCQMVNTNSSMSLHSQLDYTAKLIKCAKCDKLFENKKLLLIHQQVHYDIRRYRCFKCRKAFKTLEYLQKHNKVVHNRKMYKCTICNKLLKTKFYLKTHEKNHMNKINATVFAQNETNLLQLK